MSKQREKSHLFVILNKLEVRQPTSAFDHFVPSKARPSAAKHQHHGTRDGGSGGGGSTEQHERSCDGRGGLQV